MDSLTTLPAAFISATAIRVFMNVHADVLGTLPARVLLSLRGKGNQRAHPKTYPEKGAL
jgi:hypothetical protein